MLNFFFNIKFFKNEFLNFFFKKFQKNCYYYNSYIYRFCFKFFKNKNITYLNSLKIFNILRIIKPLDYSYKLQVDLNFLALYLKNSWITYRHFFGYPKFSKTRNNSKSSKLLSLPFKNFLLKYIFKNLYTVYTKKNKILAMHIEFLNKLWFFQWRFIWEFAKVNFLKFKIFRRKKFKFGVYFSKKNKALTFLPRKVKKNKKKIVLPKNTFNIGFYFGFSRRIKKYILCGKTIK